MAALPGTTGMKIATKDQSSTYSDRWRGQLGTLESEKGYIYKSAATEDRTFSFPTSK